MRSISIVRIHIDRRLRFKSIWHKLRRGGLHGRSRGHGKVRGSRLELACAGHRSSSCRRCKWTRVGIEHRCMQIHRGGCWLLLLILPWRSHRCRRRRTSLRLRPRLRFGHKNRGCSHIERANAVGQGGIDVNWFSSVARLCWLLLWRICFRLRARRGTGLSRTTYRYRLARSRSSHGFLEDKVVEAKGESHHALSHSQVVYIFNVCSALFCIIFTSWKVRKVKRRILLLMEEVGEVLRRVIRHLLPCRTRRDAALGWPAGSTWLRPSRLW